MEPLRLSYEVQTFGDAVTIGSDEASRTGARVTQAVLHLAQYARRVTPDLTAARTSIFGQLNSRNVRLERLVGLVVARRRCDVGGND